MVTSQPLIPMSATTQHRQPGREAASAVADAPSSAIDTPESVTGTHGSPDAVALVWDLMVDRLHQVFAESLAASPDAIRGGQRPRAVSLSPARTGLAGVRLPATRHAVNDIQDALRRISVGNYGTCEQWGRPVHNRMAAGGADPVVFVLPGRPLRLVRMPGPHRTFR